MKGSRRNFAAPFVVTASLTGCAHYEPPPAITAPRDAGEVTVVVPPDAPGHAIDTAYLFERDPDIVQTWSVLMTGSTCYVRDEFYCPWGARCNPPQPSYEKYECPAGMTPDRSAYIQQRRSSGGCTLELGCSASTAGSCAHERAPRKIDCP
jgi:hypothetical protein